MKVSVLWVSTPTYLPLIIAVALTLGLVIGLWTSKQQRWVDTKAEFFYRYQGLLSFFGLMITLIVAACSLYFASHANNLAKTALKQSQEQFIRDTTASSEIHRIQLKAYMDLIEEMRVLKEISSYQLEEIKKQGNRALINDAATLSIGLGICYDPGYKEPRRKIYYYLPISNIGNREALRIKIRVFYTFVNSKGKYSYERETDRMEEIPSHETNKVALRILESATSHLDYPHKIITVINYFDRYKKGRQVVDYQYLYPNRKRFEKTSAGGAELMKEEIESIFNIDLSIE